MSTRGAGGGEELSAAAAEQQGAQVWATVCRYIACSAGAFFVLAWEQEPRLLMREGVVHEVESTTSARHDTARHCLPPRCVNTETAAWHVEGFRIDGCQREYTGYTSSCVPSLRMKLQIPCFSLLLAH